MCAATDNDSERVRQSSALAAPLPSSRAGRGCMWRVAVAARPWCGSCWHTSRTLTIATRSAGYRTSRGRAGGATLAVVRLLGDAPGIGLAAPCIGRCRGLRMLSPRAQVTASDLRQRPILLEAVNKLLHDAEERWMSSSPTERSLRGFTSSSRPRTRAGTPCFTRSTAT